MGSRDKQRDCGEREGTSSLQGNVNTLKTEDEETKGRKRRSTVRMPMRKKLTNGRS